MTWFTKMLVNKADSDQGPVVQSIVSSAKASHIFSTKITGIFDILKHLTF